MNVGAFAIYNGFVAHNPAAYDFTRHEKPYLRAHADEPKIITAAIKEAQVRL